jgi:hypothetical protein
LADWNPLRRRLNHVTDRVTIEWTELDALVGGLPASAYNHAAFWKGDRSGWPGFTTTDVRVGSSVTFARRTASSPTRATRSVDTPPLRRPAPGRADIVLVGCVKQKLDRPAEARDLYTSSLFRKERAYAEAAGCLWFILSAEHGLVSPTTVLDPYDLRLSKTSSDYRQRWGKQVLGQLHAAVGPLTDKIIEVHAGSSYANALRQGLSASGAVLIEPLNGLTLGQRLAWYPQRPPTRALEGSARESNVGPLVAQLGAHRRAVTPAEFLSGGGVGLRTPGLYSWWVDATGATELSLGVGNTIEAGLIYAGLAGATRSRSGKRSTNTLWGRIRGMHLGGRHEFSTFRLSLGSILANAWGASEIQEARLTTWIHDHLRVVAIPVEDADTLDGVETSVLRELDPPLNLDKMPASPIRARLSELRSTFNRKVRHRRAL